MEAPPPSTAAPATAQGNSQSRGTVIVEKGDGKVKPTVPGADPQPALALDNIDLLLPPEIWVKILVHVASLSRTSEIELMAHKVDFRAPHILRIVALLSRAFYAATRLEPLWRALMRYQLQPSAHASLSDAPAGATFPLNTLVRTTTTWSAPRGSDCIASNFRVAGTT